MAHGGSFTTFEEREWDFMNRSLRIVVAEDEPAMRKYLQETLTVLGHQVVSLAEAGRELVQQCLSLNPDLVITDIRMPDMDGLAAAAIYAKELVPIIIVSAHHDADLIERAEKNHRVPGHTTGSEQPPPGPRGSQVHRTRQGDPHEANRPGRTRRLSAPAETRQ